jgi:hypothetical protein
MALDRDRLARLLGMPRQRRVIWDIADKIGRLARVGA